MPIGKKIIKRKPGSGSSSNYFNSDTQDAITAFKLEPCPKQRERLYVSRIYPAFKALVENLINVYGFKVQYDSKEDLRTECVEFLYGVITKFDPTKGSKAFSYFNVVAINWLKIKSNQNAKAIKTFASLDDRTKFSTHELELIENYNILPAPDDMITEEEEQTTITNLLDYLRSEAITDNEVSCVNAITTLFQQADSLELVNKRAVMLYIREITKLSPKQLSVVLGNLKKVYRTAKVELELEAS